jgi:hypothetical protein
MSFDDVGNASGYSVEEEEDGGFRWSAFGPRGARRGVADTRAGAEDAARAAEQELADPDAGPA